MNCEQTAERIRGNWRVYVCAAIAAALRVWLFPVFPLTGIGAFLFYGSVLLAVWFAAPRFARSNTAKFYTVLAALQLIPVLLYRSISFAMLDMAMFFALCVLAVAGEGGLLSAPFRCVRGLFRYIPVPFRDLHAVTRSSEEDRVAVLLAAVLAIPFLALVLFLLGTADDVFGSFLKGMLDDPDALPLVFARILLMAVLFLLFASGLIALRLHEEKKTERQPVGIPAAAVSTVMILFDIVYLAFAVVQVRYLFLGREAAAMQGGFAEYARKGFFQLTAIAACNCAAVWIGVRCADKRSFCRVTGGVMTALTAVILASAVYRMCLYVQVYGLSMLRLLTLYAMAVIACALVLTGRMLIGDRKCPVRNVAAFAAVLYLLVSAVNPAAQIAGWNVREWKNGSIEKLDVVYLIDLGPDAANAIRKAAAADPDNAEDYSYALRRAYEYESGNWYDRSLLSLLDKSVARIGITVECTDKPGYINYRLLWNGKEAEVGGVNGADGKGLENGPAGYWVLPDDPAYTLILSMKAQIPEQLQPGGGYAETDICEIRGGCGDVSVTVYGDAEDGYTAETRYGAE